MTDSLSSNERVPIHFVDRLVREWRSVAKDYERKGKAATTEKECLYYAHLCGTLRSCADALEEDLKKRSAVETAADPETYQRLLQFFRTYALDGLVRPSCLVCGQQPREWPPAIQHGELPGIVVCTPCRDAAQRSTLETPADRWSVEEGKLRAAGLHVHQFRFNGVHPISGNHEYVCIECYESMIHVPRRQPESHYCIDCLDAHDPETCGTLKAKGDQT